MIPSLSSVLSTNTRCPCVFTFEIEQGQKSLLHSIHALNSLPTSNLLTFSSDFPKGNGITTNPSAEISTSEYTLNAPMWSWLEMIISQSSPTPVSFNTISSSGDPSQGDETTDHTLNCLSFVHSPEQATSATENEVLNTPYCRLLIKTNEWIYQEEMASALIYEVLHHIFKST